MKTSAGAVRQMLSQMIKNGQLRNIGRGAYVHANFQECPDNADILTNGRGIAKLPCKGKQSVKTAQTHRLL